MAKVPLMRDGVPLMKDGVPLCAEEDAEDPCGCCEEGDTCPLCDDGTPATYTLTLADIVTIVGCVPCFDGLESMEGDGVDINGTYTLNYVGSNVALGGCPGGDFTTCVWSTTFVGPTITVWLHSNDCGDTSSGGSIVSHTITNWTITLTKFSCTGDLAPTWDIQITGTETVTVNLFGGQEEGTGNCEDDYPSFASLLDGTCGAGNYFGGSGGTGVISA